MTTPAEFRRLANVYVATTVVMVGILLVWNASLAIDQFRQHQAELTERSAHAAADEIAVLVEGYRRSLQIFADENQELIGSVARWPQDIDTYTVLKNKIARYFPEQFSFTLADREGQTLLYGLEAQIGEACRVDIHSFASGMEDNPVYVHRGGGKDKEHFDIMSIWQNEQSEREVLFVSFRTDSLERILEHTEVAGHRIALVLKKQPTHVDVTTAANWPLFLPDRKISAVQREKVSQFVEIPGTGWAVSILPDEKLYPETYRSILVQSLLVFVCVLLITLIMRMMLLDDQIK